jgi:hypothetical protein
MISLKRSGILKSDIDLSRLVAGHVYIIERDDGMVKIGVSIDPVNRIKNIASIGGFHINRQFISDVVIEHLFIERFLHKKFKNKRCIGEWFEVDFEIVKKTYLSKEWQTPLYKQKKEKQLTRDLKEERKSAFDSIDTVLAPPYPDCQEKFFHCSECMCPAEYYKPFENYQYDDGCCLYSDFLDLVEKASNPLNLNAKDIDRLFIKFASLVYSSYKKITDPVFIFKEFLLIAEDLGVVSFDSTELHGKTYIPAGQMRDGWVVQQLEMF